MKYPTKLKAALLVIVISSLFSEALYLGGELRKNIESPSADKVTLAERRFGFLKGFLAGSGVVGYVTDLKADTEYAKMQYVLAPVIIVRSVSYPLVIGNFHTPAGSGEIPGNPDLVPLRKFDNGIRLLGHHGGR